MPRPRTSSRPSPPTTSASSAPRGAFVDLDPFLKKDGIDPATTFPKPMLEYTQFEGNRCTLPLLGDAYGLYYNKDAFAAAGITAPAEDLVASSRPTPSKLTKPKGDSYSQLGFMPNFHGYETTTEPLRRAVGRRRTSTPTASRNVAKDPAFADDVHLAEGPGRRRSAASRSWRSTAPPSVTSGAPRTPSTPARSPCSIDGEWRLGMAKDAEAEVRHRRRAASRCPTTRPTTYGKGYLTGTIIGIASTSEQAERGLGAGEVHDHRHRRGGRPSPTPSTTCPPRSAALKSPEPRQTTRASRRSSTSRRTRTAPPPRRASTAARTR